MDNGLVHVLELYLAAKDAAVLILIVVDNGLVHYEDFSQGRRQPVLILIVVDNGLVLNKFNGQSTMRES